MPVNIHNQYAKPDQSAVDLTVSVSGMTITVAKGDVTFLGESLTLDDDIAYVATADADNETIVYGYMVKTLADGSLDIVVDECLVDGVDFPATPDPALYETLMRLFVCKVAPGETSLESGSVSSFRIIENPRWAQSSRTRSGSESFTPPTRTAPQE